MSETCRVIINQVKQKLHLVGYLLIRIYRVLVRKPEGKGPLGKPRCRWEDNIKLDLQEVGCEGMDRIELAQDSDRWQALVYAVMNLLVP